MPILPRLTFARPSTDLLESHRMDIFRTMLGKVEAEARQRWEADRTNFDNRREYEATRLHCKEVLDRITEARGATR